MPSHDAEPESMEPQEDASPAPSPTKDASEPMTSSDAGPPMVIDAGPASDLRLLQSSRFEGYLTDGDGEPLYMFVGDVPGSSETACLAPCASA
jgi:hypothetical protein